MTVTAFADRCRQLSASTGTGNLSLSTLETGYRALSSAYAVDEDLPYAVEALDAGGHLTGQWETGRGHLNGSGELVRDVLYSSSTGSFVNFTAISLRVYVTASATGLVEFVSNKVPTARLVTAGAGLTGGGALGTDLTFDIVANADGSIVVNANDIQVGILATDGQHGSRGGGSLHSVFDSTHAGFVPASGGGTSNFLRADGSFAAPTMSAYATIQEDGSNLTARSTLNFVGDTFTASDTGSKTQVVANNFTSTTRGVVPASGGGTTNFLRADASFADPLAVRTLTAGAGLTGGGSLSADRTFDVVANADGSIVVNANDLQVGVLATDAQHGNRGNGALHSSFDSTHAGFVPASGGGTSNFLRADGSFAAPAGSITQAYQTVQSAGSAVTQRSILNFLAPLVAVDNSGSTRTDVSVSTFSSGASGVVGASGGGTVNFLRADGSWTTPPGTGYATIQEDGSSLTARVTLNFVGDTFTASDTGSITQVVANNFSSTTRGVVPASGGGTTNFLRADASWAAAVPTSRTLTAGSGLTGTGDLSADRTFNVVANADGSIVVNADDLQVGVLATDAQHGARGNGTQHTAFDSTHAGFVPASGGGTTNFLRADGSFAAAVPTSRMLTAGAGLTGTGDLSADRTFNVVANADASIVVNADDIQVGVLATDAQHGSRGNGTQHTAFDSTHAGFAPASGGGSTNFLRADGTWAAPSGAGITGTLTSGRIPYATGASTVTDTANLQWDNTNGRLGVGMTPGEIIDGTKNQNGSTNMQVTNTTVGSSSRIGMGVNSDTVGFNVQAFSSGWSTSGLNIANGVKLRAFGTGLASMILSTGAAASMIFAINDVEKFRVDSAGGTVGTGSLSLGTTPSSTGQVRLPNATNVGWRNAANNADVTLGVDGSNILSSTAAFATGSGAASSGQVRLPNATNIAWRNAANSADLSVGIDSGNILQIGPATTIAGLTTMAAISNGRTAVADTNATVGTTENTVCYTSISAARTVNLPAAASNTGRTLFIVDESGSASVTNTITVDPNAAELVNGAATKVVIQTAYGAARLFCNGSAWFASLLLAS